MSLNNYVDFTSERNQLTNIKHYSPIGLDLVTLDMQINDLTPEQLDGIRRVKLKGVKLKYSLVRGRRLFVQFNATRYHNRQNFMALTPTEYYGIFRDVEDKVMSVCPQFTLEKADFCAMEVFRNAPMTHAPSDYIRALARLHIKLPHKTEFSWQSPDSHSLYQGSRTETLILYDKSAEFIARRSKRANRETLSVIRNMPKDILRAELKLVTSKKIKYLLGFSDVKSLFSQWPAVEDLHMRRFGSLLDFINPVDKAEEIHSQEGFDRLLQQGYEINSKTAANNAIMTLALQTIHGNRMYDLVMNADAGSARRNYQIRQMFANFLATRGKVDNIQIADLLAELRSKLLEPPTLE